MQPSWATSSLVRERTFILQVYPLLSTPTPFQTGSNRPINHTFPCREIRGQAIPPDLREHVLRIMQEHSRKATFSDGTYDTPLKLFIEEEPAETTP